MSSEGNNASSNTQYRTSQLSQDPLAVKMRETWKRYSVQLMQAVIDGDVSAAAEALSNVAAAIGELSADRLRKIGEIEHSNYQFEKIEATAMEQEANYEEKLKHLRRNANAAENHITELEQKHKRDVDARNATNGKLGMRVKQLEDAMRVQREQLIAMREMKNNAWSRVTELESEKARALDSLRDVVNILDTMRWDDDKIRRSTDVLRVKSKAIQSFYILGGPKPTHTHTKTNDVQPVGEEIIAHLGNALRTLDEASRDIEHSKFPVTTFVNTAYTAKVQINNAINLLNECARITSVTVAPQPQQHDTVNLTMGDGYTIVQYGYNADQSSAIEFRRSEVPGEPGTNTPKGEWDAAGPTLARLHFNDLVALQRFSQSVVRLIDKLAPKVTIRNEIKLSPELQQYYEANKDAVDATVDRIRNVLNDSGWPFDR